MNVRPVTRALRPLFVLALVAAILILSTGIAAARATSYKSTIRDGRATANALLEQSGAASLSLALVYRMSWTPWPWSSSRPRPAI